MIVVIGAGIAGLSAALAAAGALAMRHASEIALGPTGGTLADRYGARRLLVLLSLELEVELEEASLLLDELSLFAELLAASRLSVR